MVSSVNHKQAFLGLKLEDMRKASMYSITHFNKHEKKKPLAIMNMLFVYLQMQQISCFENFILRLILKIVYSRRLKSHIHIVGILPVINTLGCHNNEAP